ncbi:MAG: hypothetical protein WBM28_10010 [Burkholderiales bacterium]
MQTRIHTRRFCRIVYTLFFFTGTRLLHDGLTRLQPLRLQPRTKIERIVAFDRPNICGGTAENNQRLPGPGRSR